MAQRPDNEEAVVAGLARGDERAFRAVINATELPLRSYIATYAVDLEMIEEVLQTTYVVCFEQIGAYRAEGSLLGWLKGIARNTLFAELRRRRRARATPLGELDQWFCDHHLDRLERERMEDESQLQHLTRLRRCLGQVPERLRRLLDLRYRHDLSIGEIAERNVTTRDAMAKVLQRAVGRLRRCMEQEARAS
ncbi:MAG: RNA polymerase sigma factor [Planctomycetota bacterium]